MENSHLKLPLLLNRYSVAKEHCLDSLFTASTCTFKEETELIPSKSLSPDLDSQRVFRLVKEVPRSLKIQNKTAK